MNSNSSDNPTVIDLVKTLSHRIKGIQAQLTGRCYAFWNLARLSVPTMRKESNFPIRWARVQSAPRGLTGQNM